VATRPDSFLVSVVPSTAAGEAFAFHKKVAENDGHIWPRTEQEFQHYSESGQLFGVRRADSGEFVALCYAVLEGKEWELGGLIVDPSLQKLGIGTLLARFALAHTMVYQLPRQNGQQVIAHVHLANDEPRKLLTHLGFRYLATVNAGTAAPASMKRNADGEVVGDQYVFTPEGLKRLAKWFHEEFDGTLSKGEAKVAIDLGPVAWKDFQAALNDLAHE
jgi:ribosomal protein S18 acetylase RimI-like enzyme